MKLFNYTLTHSTGEAFGLIKANSLKLAENKLKKLYNTKHKGLDGKIVEVKVLEVKLEEVAQ